MRVGVAIAWMLAGCGRISFDPGVDARRDGQPADGNFGDAPIPLGCTGVPSTCGPAADRNCCETLPVPGGVFYRSYDVSGDGMHASMTAPATITTFWLDTYEITVGRYRRFVTAGAGTQASPPAANAGARTLNGMANQGGWQSAWTANLPVDAAAQLAAVNCDPQGQTWTDAPGANEALPMNCMNWYDAMAFCIWDGGWMPTEAEWNYAASGGDEHRAYPWSMPAGTLAIDCVNANFYNGTIYCTGTTGAATRAGILSPAGDARWGQADMSGNLWEWVLDLEAPYETPCNDCAQLTTGTVRVMRGGHFKNSRDNLRSGNRSSVTATERVEYVGVRCARGA